MSAVYALLAANARARRVWWEAELLEHKAREHARREQQERDRRY